MARTVRGISIVLLLLVFMFGGIVRAQGGAPLAAFVNASGQLVIASGDGGFRWIVTNPGEILAEPLGYTWSPDGARVFFAVDLGGEVSLRVASVGSQSAAEIGRAPRAGLSGGEWTPDSRAILIAENDRVRLYDAGGAGATDIVTGQGAVRVTSPYANNHPHLAQPRSLSPAGDYVLYQTSDGRYVLASVGGGLNLPLDLSNDFDARQSGLWAASGGLVAYWGYSGGSALAVTSAPAAAAVILDSGRSVPISPLAWSGSRLVYRDAEAAGRLADLACLLGGCAANPLEAGVDLLPAAASDVQVYNEWVIFRSGDSVNAVPLSCVGAGNCADSILPLGGSAAPDTIVDVGGSTLIYTAYGSDPNNRADREVRAINLGCLGGGGCSPQPVMNAQAGLVSSDGRYVVVQGADGALNVRDLNTGALGYLSEPGASLLRARWNG